MDDISTNLAQNIRAAFDAPRENITIDNKTIILEESKIILGDTHDDDHEACIRMDTYNIDSFFVGNTSIKDLYRKLFNHIPAHIIRTVTSPDVIVKYTCFIENSPNTNKKKKKNDIKISFNTNDKRLDSILNQLRNEINSIEVRNFDYIINEEDYNRGLKLVIIRERITMTEIEDVGITNEEKTFQQDKCMICLDKEPNVLFCSCGHFQKYNVFCKKSRVENQIFTCIIHRHSFCDELCQLYDVIYQSPSIVVVRYSHPNDP